MKMALLFSLLALPAAADDSISVTINGRSFSCGGDGHQYKYYCHCAFLGGSDWTLSYRKLDLDTGAETEVKIIKFSQYESGCRADMEKASLCR